MQRKTYLAGGAAALAVVLLGSCDAPMVGSDTFQDQYLVARNALETGNYDKAGRTYARLVPEAGPLTPRIKLEVAHTHLRANEYSAAIAEASSVAKSASGDARSAALAVQGTAQHELAMQQLANGDTDAAKAQLTAAQAALAEVLKDAPQLDPLGSLAGRQAQIKVQLARL